MRQLLGVTGQYASVDENLTGYENLWLFGRLLGLSRAESRERATSLLAQFGLEDAADRQISKFSGGMRRRLDLAVSLITRPPLIFLDEPTTGLDPRTRGQMWTTIRELVADGCTVLLTTQYLDEADQLADRIAVIDRGVKVAEGTPDQLKSSVGSSTLQLRIADPAYLQQAAAVLARVLPDEPVLTPEAGGINVPLNDADQAAEALIALRQAEISVASVSVAKPTLDEVFLALTGHDTNEDADAHRPHRRQGTGGRPMTTLSTFEGIVADPAAKVTHRVSPADTVSQTMTMAWRATKKMRRNPEQFFDVVFQPLLFTAMFAYIFGGAVSGSVQDYLPLLIPGILAQTTLTACIATGIQLREDMDKGVFDRFKSLPIARIAPLAGPMVADLLRYTIATVLTFATGIVMGYRPGGGVFGVVAATLLVIVDRLVAGLDLHLRRDHRPQRPGGAGHLDDDHVPADVPVQRLRARGHAARAGCRRSCRSTRSRTWSPRCATSPTTGTVTAEVGWALLACVAVVAVFAPLSVRAYRSAM